MNEIKWIKIATDIFDDEKILLIEAMPEPYSIIICWFKLLCFAGKQNNSGVFKMGNIVYNDKMLATIFRMKESTVTMALNIFEQFGMITKIENGVITITNWGKHQNLDQIESKKEYMRKYMEEYRKKQIALASGDLACKTNSKANGKTNSKANVSRAEEDKEEDKEGDNKKESIADCAAVLSLYQSICKSYPAVQRLSDARRKAIKARLNTYTLADFETVFRKAQDSDFLKGKNNRNWSATFDWLLKDANFCKVLEGNYDNKAAGAGNRTIYGCGELGEAELEAIQQALRD